MPGFTLSEEDKAGLTQAEIDALSGDNADELLAAHGGTATQDDTGAEDDDADATDDSSDDGADDAHDDKTEDDKASQKTDEAATDEGTDDDDGQKAADEPTQAQRDAYKVEGPKDFKAERQALRDKRDEVEAKWSAGELSDAERKQQIRELDDQIDDLLIAHTRAETLRNANEQAQERAWDAAIADVSKAGKAVGIDYTQAKNAKQFDAMLNALTADPDNATKTPAQLANDAHRAVMALRGIATPQASAGKQVQKTDPPAAPARRNVPSASLTDVPAAAPTGMDDNALEKFKSLEGEDAEDYLASLPRAEQDRILRAADATAMTFSSESRASRRRGAGHGVRSA